MLSGKECNLGLSFDVDASLSLTRAHSTRRPVDSGARLTAAPPPISNRPPSVNLGKMDVCGLMSDGVVMTGRSPLRGPSVPTTLELPPAPPALVVLGPGSLIPTWRKFGLGSCRSADEWGNTPGADRFLSTASIVASIFLSDFAIRSALRLDLRPR